MALAAFEFLVTQPQERCPLEGSRLTVLENIHRFEGYWVSQWLNERDPDPESPMLNQIYYGNLVDHFLHSLPEPLMAMPRILLGKDPEVGRTRSKIVEYWSRTLLRPNTPSARMVGAVACLWETKTLPARCDMISPLTGSSMDSRVPVTFFFKGVLEGCITPQDFEERHREHMMPYRVAFPANGHRVA